MKKISIILIVLALASFTSAKEVLVTGTVKSFATNEVIESAAVFALGASLTMTTIPDSVDTFFTDSNGSFSKTITVPDGSDVLVYGAQKEGYLIKNELQMYFIIGIPDQVDLGDIFLKTLGDATDTLEIIGSVIDSISKEPVAEANVLLTSGAFGDITIDTVKTDNNGNFEANLPFIPSDNGALFNFMLYNVSKELYASKGDTAGISSDNTVDIGAIEIVKINTPVTPIFNHISRFAPTHFSVYTLQGKKIHSGSMSKFAKLKKSDFSNQQLIIKFFRNDNLVSVEKIIKK